ncbi:MAG: ABC transporter ATP-binding protein [Bacillota bacterium]|jgi:ATP-binding cassette subfamily B multidrug efflux pump
MLKTLAGCIREYKRDSLLSPLFVIFEVLLEVFIPLVMAMLIDHGIEAGNVSVTLQIGAVLLALSLLSMLFGSLSGIFAANASAGYAKNLRHDMFHNVQNFAFSNIDRFSTASIVTRLTTDVTNVQNAYMMIIRIAVRAPVMMICALIMAFGINAKIAGIFLIAVPFLAVGLYLIMTKAHPLFRKMFYAYDDMNNVVQENLHGVRVVKAYVREEHEDYKFKKVATKIYDIATKAEKLLMLNSPLMQFTAYGCMLLVAWFGARAIILTGGSALTTGELTSLFSYIMQILISLMMLSMIFVMIIMSRASAERITEIINESSDLKDTDTPIFDIKDGSVDFEHVWFAYKKDSDRKVLKDIDLHIKSGETIGIIGGTGSAKSSFVQLIPRIYDAGEGVVKVGGVDVRDYDLTSLRNNVSFVLQKNVLFSGTIKENLRWGDENATDEELVHACRLAQADGFIREFPDGYDTYIEQGGTNVSGGQKQRLCIARALLKKPKILILDDSTSAVDTGTDALISQAFKTEIPDTTKLIIAQRISSVQNADRIIVLDNGTIVGFGTHEELLADNDIYREVYESQQKGDE